MGINHVANTCFVIKNIAKLVVLFLLLLCPLDICTAQTRIVGDFQSEIRFASATWAIGVGDFNRDGRMDFVASSSNNTIVVFLGNGDGTFQTPVQYAVNDPLGVAVGDLNGDGKLDIVVANFNSLGTTFGGGVSILFGNGDGTFQPAVFYTTGKNPTAVAIGDLNGDGKPDLVVTDVQSNDVSVLLNAGAGTFGKPIQFPSGASPYAVAITDVNRDAHNDIVVTNYCDVTASGQSAAGCSTASFSPNTISVLLGNGDGSFQGPVSYAAGTGPFQVAVGDLNADGWPDVVVSDNLGTTLSVLLNNGNGTFRAPSSYVVGHIPLFVAIADFNGDGKPDLAATTRDNTLVELLGNGDGTFQPAINYFSGTTFLGLQTADFNNDSRTDIVAGTGQFTVGAFLNAGGTIRAQTSIVISPSANPALTLVDIVIHATVTSVGALPTGSVTLYLDGIPAIGPDLGQLDASGQSSFDLGTLTSGSHSISAIYSGDTLTQGSTSALLSETINLRSTALQLSSSVNPSVVGQTITLEAVPTDTSSPPLNGDITGTVTFNEGATILGTSPLIPQRVGSPIATLSISNLAAGTHQIVGTYSGDQNFATAVSAPLVQVVNTAPAASVSPATVSFGSQIVNSTSSAQAVTLSNTGSATLNINGVSITGAFPNDFAESNNCPSGLSTNATCTINVSFTPSTTGLRSATLSISDNASGSPQAVGLSGTGISFGLAIPPGSSASAAVQAGGTASYTLSMGGAGFGGTISLMCAIAVIGANCVVPANVSVDANAASTLVVEVATSPPTLASLAPSSWTWLWAAIVFGLAIMPRVRHTRQAVQAFVVLMLLVLSPLFYACGSGSAGPRLNPNGTPPGTYTLTVTGNSGSASQSILLTLVVR